MGRQLTNDGILIKSLAENFGCMDIRQVKRLIPKRSKEYLDFCIAGCKDRGVLQLNAERTFVTAYRSNYIDKKMIDCLWVAIDFYADKANNRIPNITANTLFKGAGNPIRMFFIRNNIVYYVMYSDTNNLASIGMAYEELKKSIPKRELVKQKVSTNANLIVVTRDEKLAERIDVSDYLIPTHIIYLEDNAELDEPDIIWMN